MNILHTLYDELIGFTGLHDLIEVYKTGNYDKLLTLQGLFGVVAPLLPFLLILEMIRALVYKRFKIEDYRVPFTIFVVNRFIGRFISIAAIMFCIGIFEKIAPFQTTFTWYWFIYGYIVWEFGHFLYHYWGHKVRLFWCLHATHHVPEQMNLSVSYAHFFLEGAYADVIRTTVCILLGVNPPMLFFIMFIDGVWGGFIHVGENIIKDGRLGFLNKWILTPSHHRVHHAKNPLYMDTNFCNLLNIWDRVFGTHQPEVSDLKIEYGVSRNVNTRNFFDVYFGEFYYLALDVWKAPGLMNKVRYIFMPPGWSHTGDHKTAVVVKKAYKESLPVVDHSRREFIRTASLSVGALMITSDLFARDKGPVYGYNGMKYTLDTAWSKCNPQQYPVNDCHEMVLDKKGRIFLLTNETKNNVLIYNSSGKVLDAWGHDFPGAHGLTIHDENGTEFLYITDTVKHQVYKTTLDGKLLLTIDAPSLYKQPEKFVPTETTIAPNGDIFIADGYGEQYVLHYNAKGELLNYFGGRGPGDEHLDNAHGILYRNGSLLVTDRTRNCFKNFSLDGKLQDIISLPGACVCRPVVQGDHIYAAVLRSPDMNKEGSGFVTIIDKNNKVVSNIGGSEPTYVNGILQPMSQTDKIFVHPHDVCVDKDHNLYVAQWASGKVYPYKLKRV